MKMFYVWQIVKPIKSNFRSNGLLALILVYTIHQSTVHLCTRFQLCTLTVLEKNVGQSIPWTKSLGPLDLDWSK